MSLSMFPCLPARDIRYVLAMNVRLIYRAMQEPDQNVGLSRGILSIQG